MIWLAARLFLGKAWGGIVAFIQTPLGRHVTAGAIALLAGLLYGHVRYDAGVKHQKTVYAAELVKARAHVAKVEAKSAAISADVGEKNDRRQVEIRTVTKTLIKEVPYAVLQDPDRPNVSNGFVRLHEQAAIGVSGVPEAPGRPDAAPSAITDAQLAEAIIDNYGTCLANAQTVTAWQEYWSRQADLWNKEVSAKR